MEPPNIKAKPGEATEEVDRRNNSRCREELGPFCSGSVAAYGFLAPEAETVCDVS